MNSASGARLSAGARPAYTPATMAEPVNLNRFRKARARQQARLQADRNAVVHGLPKAERSRAKAEAERAARTLDAKRREDPAEKPE
ncbi:DUF4169 family protein [Tropicimonas sp. IMCC34043]|uniref:DUF4169 family protein n=1 Tax=Tropicimonas sp. IMCC34043 TaxID=2248760 RepID=UPI001E4739DD|nr:DUF4169 family protein [Tropicimonas sp. IMCC34043]